MFVNLFFSVVCLNISISRPLFIFHSSSIPTSFIVHVFAFKSDHLNSGCPIVSFDDGLNSRDFYCAICGKIG